MSTQSILHNTKSSLSDKADEFYMALGYKLRNNIRFGIGKEVDLNTFDLVRRMERIMCEDNCRLGGAEDKIKEKLNLLILNCK